MKMIHKNLGEVELLSELGAINQGRTLVKTKDGFTVEASTGYLKPIPESKAQAVEVNEQPT